MIKGYIIKRNFKVYTSMLCKKNDFNSLILTTLHTHQQVMHRYHTIYNSIYNYYNIIINLDMFARVRRILYFYVVIGLDSNINIFIFIFRLLYCECG